MKNLAHRWRPRAPSRTHDYGTRRCACGARFVPQIVTQNECITCATAAARARGYK